MLKKLQEELAIKIFKMSKDEATEKGICISCQEPALQNCYSEAGVEEYRNSGLCEKCFDEITSDHNPNIMGICEYCGKEIKANEEIYLVEHHTYCSGTCYGHDVGF